MKIINVNGGIGRVIAFTGILETMTEKPIIVTGFPDVFKNNPHVGRIYGEHHAYLWEDVISKGDYSNPEPYEMKEYYADKKHVALCFNKLITGEEKYLPPKLYLSDDETSPAKKFIASQEKPVVLLQCWSSTGGRGEIDTSLRSLDPVFADKLYKALSEKYTVFHIRGQDQINMEGAKTFDNTQRQIMALLPFVKAVVCIDSFLQHACAALDRPAFVFWGGTREENFGYPIHNNYRKHKLNTWYPLRMPVDASKFYEENKTVMDFDDEDIVECVKWVDEQ